MLVGNVDAFLGTSFGWFYPQVVSSCPAERAIIGIAKCRAMRVSLA